jgi:hypothetical protein
MEFGAHPAVYECKSGHADTEHGGSDILDAAVHAAQDDETQSHLICRKFV